MMDDLSSVKNDDKQEFKISDTVMKLLKICGNIYMPFLKANSDAFKKKQDMFNVDLVINGKVFNHKQKPFKWQVRCLAY